MILAIFRACISHGEILRIDADRRAVDRARADDHAVAMQHLLVHVEITRLVFDEQVVLREGVLIEQRQHAFARRELAHGLLLFDGGVAAALLDEGATFAQLGNALDETHG